MQHTKAGGRSIPKLNLADVKPAVNNFMVEKDSRDAEIDRLRQQVYELTFKLREKELHKAESLAREDNTQSVPHNSNSRASSKSANREVKEPNLPTVIEEGEPEITEANQRTRPVKRLNLD